MTRPRPAIALKLGSVATLVSLAFAAFFRGFFPIKPLVPGYSLPEAFARETGDPSSRPFSRLVFVLVDALRSDFVFSSDSSMAFARSLVETDRASPYTAIAQPPTVTLSRLKALTTGSNPTFLDAILNIADETSTSAGLEHVDSWVRQFRTRGRGETRIAFAGDDTWLRLFPREWFTWSEGVSSFFVSDTEVVDANVTRHLDALLAIDDADVQGRPPTDWDVLVLHYLGLDHVGHLEGPNSPLMGPKQEEMDDVVRRVFETLQRRDEKDGGKSLLVLVGDHGMTEGGNHGGSTEGETSSALLIISPSLEPESTSRVQPERSGTYGYHEVVHQVDLVPTLSVLFDLGIPQNSIGKVIESAVRRLRPSALESGLRGNVNQIEAVLRAAGIDGETLLCQVAADHGLSCGEKLLLPSSVHSDFLRRAQDQLMNSVGDYNLVYLALSCAGLALTSAYLVKLSITSAREERPVTKRLVTLALAAHLGSFFATSFIEEEHEFWYFVTATSCLLLALGGSRTNRDRISLVASAAGIRVMRSWSPNGQKDVPNESISFWLAQHDDVSSLLMIATYVFVLVRVVASLSRAARSLAGRGLSPGHLFRHALAFAVLATIACLQVATGVLLKLLDGGPSHMIRTIRELLEVLELDNPVILARSGYVLGSLGWSMSTLLSRFSSNSLQKSLSTIRLAHVSLVLMSLTRQANVPLFSILWLHRDALDRLASSTSPLVFALTFIAFQSASFFALGGSNSLATVDLSQAYNGLSSYSFPLVTLLTYLSNFSGPLFFAVSSRLSLSSDIPPSPPSRAPTTARQSIYTTTFFALSLTTMALSATHFRYHLFAFTVFSPAVLYKGVWWAFVQLGTNEGWSRLLSI
ncbi:hypothetical protein JCM10212_004766 [Sporobolomyces blumeae]